MSALLRRLGLFLLMLANRLEQRSHLTLALEPLSPALHFEEALYEIRHRASGYDQRD